MNSNNPKDHHAAEIIFHFDGDIGYGQRRTRLEDRYIAQALTTASGFDIVVGIVADGVGGGNAGERASQMTVDQVLTSLHESTVVDVEIMLDEAIHTAHEAVRQAGQQNPKLRSMSTTVTVAVIHDNRLYIGHVGDSRAYLVRGDDIRLLTLDHSWANEMIRQEKFRPDEVENHPKKGDLGRYIGQPKQIPLEVDLGYREIKDGQHPANSTLVKSGLELQPGDVVILCSDGLIKERHNAPGHFVEDAEIVDAVRRKRNSPEDIVNTLLSRALGRQTDDNVSVVALVVPGGKESILPLPPVAMNSLPKWGVPVAVVVLIVIIGIILITMFWRGNDGEISSQPTTVSEVGLAEASLGEPGAGFAMVVEGLAEYSAPGQSPVFVVFDQELQPGADTKLWTTTGYLIIELSDKSLVYLDENTTITLLRTYDTAANSREAEVQIEKGRLITRAINPVIVRPSQHGFQARAERESVMGVEYRSGDGYLSADCLAGNCILDDQVDPQQLTQGQRGEINKGLMKEVLEADYQNWLPAREWLEFPLPTNTPTPTATATATPIPPTETPLPIQVDPIDPPSSDKDKNKDKEKEEPPEATTPPEATKPPDSGP